MIQVCEAHGRYALTRHKNAQSCVRCRSDCPPTSMQGYCTRCTHIWRGDRAAAIGWARTLLEVGRVRRNWVLLDTETTGLHPTAEIVEIGILAPDGTCLLNSLVRPQRPIPAEATHIHHITDDWVRNAKTFAELYPSIRSLLYDRVIVVYNAQYDHRVLEYERQRYRLPPLPNRRWSCAMLWYAKWRGEWNGGYRNYRWHPLQSGDHSALGDCHATLDVLHEIAGYER